MGIGGRRVILNRIPVPDGLAQAGARPFFNRAIGCAFSAKQAGEVTEIALYDEIGAWGVTAKDFRALLPGKGGVRVRVHSPGGDVFDGIAIHNDLRDHDGRVEIEIPGLAASAASIVAMAGDTIRMAPGAFLMIHNAWGLVVGDRRDMERVAGVLGQIDEALADTYVARTGKPKAEIVGLMDEETWLDGEAAVASGFADEVVEMAAPEARFDLSGFQTAPKDWALPRSASPVTFRDYERLLTQDAGLSRSQARALLRNGLSVQATQDAGDDAELVAAATPLLNELMEELGQ